MTKELNFAEMENLQGGIYDPLGCLIAEIDFENALNIQANSPREFVDLARVLLEDADRRMAMYCHHIDPNA